MIDSIYFKLFQMLIKEREVCSLHSLEDCICKMIFIFPTIILQRSTLSTKNFISKKTIQKTISFKFFVQKMSLNVRNLLENILERRVVSYLMVEIELEHNIY